MNQELSFGAFIRQRRREMDLTQEELARRVGCAAITLRKIEADDLRASVQIAERIAMALAIPLEQRAEFVRRARAVRPESSELPPVTPPPSMDEIGGEDLTGRAIRGYALAERIGMGGMGSVYRAVQPNVEREVAVKIILPAFANHPDFIRRFEAEAQLVARLEHPHIVPLYDYWREPGVAYLVMRLLRGGSIQQLIDQGPLSMVTTSHLLEQICSALHTAHRIGVIHRDLKPANVLLDEDNNAYLADFGIAKNLGNPDFENQTQVDVMIGSPQYMSPEQIQSLSVRPQTDIYCLGVMLYEMLTGTVPFTGPTPFDMIQQHVSAPMPPLSARQAGLPAALDKVIGQATAKDPQDRYEDALSLYRDFRQAVSSMMDVRPIAIEHEEEESGAELVNPFKGLRAFGEGDAENFFGRETLIQQLLARLGEGGDLSRFLAVIGPSGSGKSSVVRAGLIPALRRGGLPGSENWFIVDMLPGKHPFEELEASLLRVAVNPPQSLLSQLKDGERGLMRAVHRILPADDSVELVLVIDQFEEVFTLIEEEAERSLLLENLATAALDERSRLHVIITLRADFTDKPLRYVDFGELMNRRFEFVLPLTPDELERAVVGPSEHVGLKLEKGLVSTIVREVGNQPGALPLMQYALSELFDKREGRTLTNKAYKEISGVLGALGRSAETLFSNMSATERSATRQLFLRLVTVGEGTEDTRRRVLREEIGAMYGDHQVSIQKVMDAFGKARLVSFDRDPITRGATIEVAHEALLREWTRLREWLNESRADVRLQRQLASAAHEWKTMNKDASFLLSGTRLEQFEGWAVNTTVALTQNEHTYLGASVAERQKLVEKEKQSVLRLRRLNRILSLAGGVATILAVIAFIFSQQAAANAKVATIRELSIAADLNLEVDPERSLLLALEAVELAGHNQDSAYFEAQEALHRAVLASRARQTFYINDHHGAWTVAYSPDGKRLATTSQDGVAQIWDVATGKEILKLEGHNGSVNGIVFSPDGTRIATTGEDRTAKIWDASTGEEIFTLSGFFAGTAQVAFSPDGRKYAVSGYDGKIIMVDATNNISLFTLQGNDAMFSVSFNPDGTRFATAEPSKIHIWDANNGELILRIDADQYSLAGLAFSPNGKIIAATYNDWVRLFDAQTGEFISDIKGFNNIVYAVAFNPNGTQLAAGGLDRNAKVFDVSTGKVLYTLSGHDGFINGVTFSPDGKSLATASQDGTVRVWDITLSKEAFTIPITYTPGRVHVTKDGSLAVIATDFRAVVVDLKTGETLATTLSDNENFVNIANINLDGTLVATTYDSGTVKVWDVKTQELVKEFAGPDFVIYPAFSPDGKMLAALSEPDLYIWDLASGQLIHKLSGTQFTYLVFSPDSRHLLTGDNQNNAILWDVKTGSQLLTLPHFDTVWGAAFNSDGSRIATASRDATAKIWDAQTGKEIFTLKGHTGTVVSIAFSPDDSKVATASKDGTLKMWNANTGELILTLSNDGQGFAGVAFGLDGDILLGINNADLTELRAYLLDPADLVALATSQLTRSFTEQECKQYLHVDLCPSVP